MHFFQGGSQASVTTSIDPVTALTLVLAALAALLTVLAIVIGIAAVWSFFGIRDSVKEMAEKRVGEAIAQKLNEYPPAADIIAVLGRLRQQAEFQDQLRNQAVTAPEPKSVEIASKSDVQVQAPETPLEAVNQQVTPIEKYPGEGDKDASGDGKSG